MNRQNSPRLVFKMFNELFRTERTAGPFMLFHEVRKIIILLLSKIGSPIFDPEGFIPVEKF